MSFFGIDTWEFLILIALGAVLIGPEHLPEYSAKVREWIRQARDMAEGTKTQLKEQMGPEFESIDWRQYDPRQYDPRRIIKDALFGDDAAAAPTEHEISTESFDPDTPTPFDTGAT